MIKQRFMKPWLWFDVISKGYSPPGQVELIKMLKTNDEGEYVINVGFVK